MAYNPIPRKKEASIMLIGLAVALGAMYYLRTCSSTTADYILRPSGGDTIDVAIEYSPLSLYRYCDTLGGFNYDMLRMIATRHNLTLKFHPVVSLPRSLKRIDDNVYDILAADIPATTDFKDRYTFLEPVILDRQVLVQRKDSLTGEPAVKSQLDLAGDTVWIVDGSSVKSRITNLAHEIGDTIYVSFEQEYGPEQLFIMTAVGEIEKAVIPERIAREMAVSYPEMDINTDISFTQFQSWIVSDKRPELRDSLNIWINKFKLSDEYNRLRERYLN